MWPVEILLSDKKNSYQNSLRPESCSYKVIIIVIIKYRSLTGYRTVDQCLL